jgi:hypothetical protein
MIDFRIERGWSFDGYQAWIIEHRNGQSYIARPIELEFVPIPDGSALPEPTLKLGGPFAKEFLAQAKKALAGFNSWDKKEYEVSARIEKAMQAHIDSLKLVVDRALKP